MDLVVHELGFTSLILTQPVIPSKTTLVGSVRPHLYVHNRPSGTITVVVVSEDGEAEIGTSATLNIQDITDADYFHGHVTFELDAYLLSGQTYKIQISTGGGYSFSESAYVGVCGDYDSRLYPLGYSPAGVEDAPLDIQIWERTTK
jgi:hypothetical protein